MKKLDEILLFERLLETTKNELIEQAIQEGKVPIGYNCYVVPRPLLSVGKAFPVRLRAPGISTTEIADYYMTSMLCSCSRSILEAAINGDFDFLGGLVFANSCQHSTRCGQYFTMKGINSDKENFFSYILEAPRKDVDRLIESFVKYLKKVAELISEKYKINMSDEALTKAIHQQNEFNLLLQEISDMRKDVAPKITGSEFHKMMLATQVAPNDLLEEPIKQLRNNLKKRKGISDYRARLMVVGPNLDNPSYIELIEDQGAVVVADRFCFGSLPGLEIISENGDPYENLARHYLKTCECPRMIDMAQTRLDKIIERVKEFKVDGVVIETIKFCDMWGYETLILEEGLKKAGIPIVKIEREYSFSNEGQFRTRIQAFIESIESKRLSKIKG